MDEKKIAASSALLSALEKDPVIREDDVREISRQMQEAAIRDLSEAIAKGKKEFPGRDFFIEMFIYQSQTVSANQAINRCIVGPLCPTPTHGHAVWRVSGLTGIEELLWSLPPVKECLQLMHTPKEMREAGDEELLGYIKDFMLMKLRQKSVDINIDLEKKLKAEL